MSKEKRVEPDFSGVRAFAEINASNGEVCPICGEVEGGAAVLVPIVGTSEGGIVQAVQVHVKCIVNKAVYYEPILGVSFNGNIVASCPFSKDKKNDSI